MRILSVAALAAVFSGGPAIAASPMGQLRDVAGNVYINRGAGFTLADGPRELYVGDRVMVAEDGSASISYYLASCNVPLAATSLTTISAAAPCTSTAQLPAQGVAQKTAPSANTTLIIAGGVGVAATIGGVLALTTGGDDDDDDNGVSP